MAPPPSTRSARECADEHAERRGESACDARREGFLGPTSAPRISCGRRSDTLPPRSVRIRRGLAYAPALVQDRCSSLRVHAPPGQSCTRTQPCAIERMRHASPCSSRHAWFDICRRARSLDTTTSTGARHLRPLTGAGDAPPPLCATRIHAAGRTLSHTHTQRSVVSSERSFTLDSRLCPSVRARTRRVPLHMVC